MSVSFQLLCWMTQRTRFQLQMRAGWRRERNGDHVPHGSSGGFIKAVAESCPKMLVGAGTVVTLDQCKTRWNAVQNSFFAGL